MSEGVDASTRTEAVEAFVTASRALVGIAVRSIESSPVPITVPQQRVLVLLASHGSRTVASVAEQLGVNQSNASRICARLERLGLAARRRDPDDARAVQVTVTRAGAGVLAAVSETRRREVAALLSGVPDTDLLGAMRGLEAFNQAAHEVAEAAWVDWGT